MEKQEQITVTVVDGIGEESLITLEPAGNLVDFEFFGYGEHLTWTMTRADFERISKEVLG